MGLFLIGYLHFDTNFHIESRHLGLYEPQKSIFDIVNNVSDKLSKTLDFTTLENFCVKESYDTDIYNDKNIHNTDLNIKKDEIKFINTGTIDKYKILWGSYDTQYIKSKYISSCLCL